MKKNISYQADVLEHFIPVSLKMLTTDLSSSDLLSADQQLEFEKFYTTYIALFRAKEHSKLQKIKNIYRPFNPDSDSLFFQSQDKEGQLGKLKTELSEILENANYIKLSENDLNEALNKISPHGVKVSVDFEDFSEVALFYRGSATHTKLHSNWKKFQFKKIPVKVQVYRRLFVLLKPKNKLQWIAHLTNNKQMSLKKAEKKANDLFKKQGVSGEDNFVYMKLFKDIPRADLEMLFPNTRIQIRLFDKIKLAIMGGGGTAGGIMATITKLSAAIEPLSAVIAVGGLLGIIWRQIAKIFSQRAKYSAILTKNLYFYSLDNNMGALTYLADTARSENCKEAILAYFFLLTSGQINRQVLDERIEDYIQRKYAIPMDFEIDDGLDKLKKLELLIQHNDLISTIPLPEANNKIIQHWNRLIEKSTNLEY